MKAEHRKELETNVLADRLGRMVTNLKQGPQRGVTVYVVLGVLVAALAFIVVRWYRVTKTETTEAWVAFALGGAYDPLGMGPEGRLLRENHPETKPGIAQRFVLAAHILWEEGIKKLGTTDQKGALEKIDLAQKVYELLKTDAAGDPLLEPEAMYALAQIEECRAIEDRDKLESAKELYEELAKAHPNSPYGQLAQKRAEVLSDRARRDEVADVYVELGRGARFDRK